MPGVSQGNNKHSGGLAGDASAQTPSGPRGLQEDIVQDLGRLYPLRPASDLGRGSPRGRSRRSADPGRQERRGPGHRAHRRFQGLWFFSPARSRPATARTVVSFAPILDTSAFPPAPSGGRFGGTVGEAEHGSKAMHPPSGGLTRL